MIEGIIEAVQLTFASRGVYQGLTHISFIILCCVWIVYIAGVIVTASIDYVYDKEGNLTLRKMFPHIEDYDWYHERGFVYFITFALLSLGGGAVCLSILPLALYLIFYIPWLAVGIASVYATLRIARGVVRLKNKLSLHVADTDAHKEN